ncbi:MAG: 50S ribosomal protein L15 [Deltaproteobacteria bacterium]|nr:MAG: 50S ribosomal protein L15 [Deltaproteobacteria bacterium]
MEERVDLGHLHPAPGSRRPRKRVGRGPGSGNGKTAGRGHKGRLSRSGGNTPPGYEGGQMPLQRRLPKRGFRPVSRREYAIVNLEQLAVFAPGSTVGPDELRSRRLVRGPGPVKCLGDGTLPHALTVRLHAFSKTARERIAAAGGTVETIGV